MSKLYQNKWAGHETYFVPLHPVRTRKGEASAVGGYEIICIDGVWKCQKGSYYTHSLRDEEHFPVVGNVKIDIIGYVMDKMLAEVNAISALEKQEQANTQNINSTHTSRPNALESLNILERAKDNKGCVPMSLVRQAFRNILEKDRWIPVTERLPEEDCECRVTSKNNFGKSVFDCYWNEGKKQFESWDYFLDDYYSVYGVTAWKPIEEPYTEEES